MTATLLVLRPEPGASATAASARALGFDVIVTPLFTVCPLDWSLPATPPEAVLMTSANAARHAGGTLAALTGLPLYAVGAATAAAARQAGFTRIIVGERGVDAIVEQAARGGVGRLLHLAGRDHRALAAVQDISIERRFVYAADAVTSLPDAVRRAVPGKTVALLHSPRAASLFAALVDAEGDPAAVSIAAISPAAREAAGEGWRAAVVADRPTDASLLAAAAKLCDHGR